MPEQKNEKPAVKRDVKAITFLVRYDRYNKGETAGFPAAIADDYIKLKVAALPAEAEKILSKEKQS